ncbi:MAG: DUF3791 domain-containing protein [Lentisphaeria bacterium]|nr:DUF3791 domain-containing protein [Lentisphaeria bacterium]
MPPEQQEPIMSKPVLDFAIFCIEGVAEKLQLPGNVVYDLLTRKSRILPDYIVSSYDVLHTQSKQYIVDDIISFMKEEGVIA